MSSTTACATIFFHASLESLVSQYHVFAEQEDGYLTRLNGTWVFVDALATATADWVRQCRLAMEMSIDGATAVTVVLIGDHWAMILAHDGQTGPSAVYVPGQIDYMRQLPIQLLSIEQGLVELFPDRVEAEDVDQLLGALVDGAMTAEEAINALLEMIGCPPDWLRWSWYESIPEQIFTDPDYRDRVVPLGEAGGFWEE